jgi:uncharacterized protein
MRYRRFGKTNLHLSVFSLGTMRCLSSAENTWQTVQQALDHGINHLETARGYGKSEEYLGRAMQAGLSVPRSQLVITTKIPPSLDAASTAQAISDSLERLQIDYLDCLAIHGINTPAHLAWIQSDQGCMQAVRQALAEGKIRHVGFSTHGSLEVILGAIATNQFEFVNLHYTFFFQRNAQALELATENDMGIFIISPADKGGLLYTPPDILKTLCEPFSPLVLNYRFLLSDRRITTLSLGAAKPEELAESLSIADHDQPLTASEVSVLRRLETHQAEHLGPDHCRQCYECLPCPEAIHIPEVLRLRNLAVAFGMTEFGQYRYRMFENAGHWFPGQKASRCTDCGECLPRCPEALNIPVLLKDTDDRLRGQEGRRLWE